MSRLQRLSDIFIDMNEDNARDLYLEAANLLKQQPEPNHQEEMVMEGIAMTWSALFDTPPPESSS